MTRRQFRLYFYFYIALFVVLLGAILFYTLGYRYNYRTGETIQTGGMVVRSEVEGVSVFNNGESVKKSGLIDNLFNSFIKVENLRPGKYNLEVKKDGYQTWHKEVEITSGKLEKFENVLLLKNQYEPREVLPQVDLRAQKQVWYFPQQNRIAYVDSVGDFYILDLFQNQTTLILTAAQLVTLGEVRSLTVTPNPNLWIFRTHAKGHELVQILQSDVKRFHEIPDTLQPALVFAWDHQTLRASGGRLWFTENNQLFTYELSPQRKLMIAEGVQAFALDGEKVYYAKSETVDQTSFYQKDTSGGNEIRLARVPSDFNVQAPLEVQNSGRYFWALNQKNLYILNKYNELQKIAGDVEKAQFFKNGKRLLYTSANEIRIYYTENQAAQPLKFAGEQELVTRWSGEIKDLTVYKDEEHLLYVTGKEWKVVELDDRYYRNTQIISASITDQTFYDFTKNRAYFLQGGKLWNIEL